MTGSTAPKSLDPEWRKHRDFVSNPDLDAWIDRQLEDEQAADERPSEGKGQLPLFPPEG